MPKMQSFNSNSEIYADFGLLRGEICKWLYNIYYKLILLKTKESNIGLSMMESKSF